MPKAKAPEPVIPFTEFERSRLIVQLRYEMALDHAKAFRNAGTSTARLDQDQREMLCAIGASYETQAHLLKSTLDLTRGK